MNVPARPRLLYFNGPWDFLGERMRRSFIEPFHALLAQDFEVISVEGDRDFAREVEQHRPDLVLFHSGCEAPREPAVTITNTDAYPELPRIGYIYRDPFSPSRLIAMNRTELQQVLVNLLVNAIHAMPHGGRLLLRNHDSDMDGWAGVAIEVADTGAGISAEVIERVFDPFFTTKTREGTGLGLSISQMLVTRQGGRISVSSEPGRGTTFLVWLPEAG